MVETVHFVFGRSAAGSIRQALRQIGCKERVVGFSDDLSLGPIDRTEPRAREAWIVDELGYDFEEVCRGADHFWTEATSRDVSPVAWVCRNHPLEYSGYLEFVWRMAETPFRVIDATDVVMPNWRAHDSKVWSLGVLTPTQIIEARLFESQRGLPAQEKARHLDLWRRLRAENAPLRVIDANGLVSAPITHFDEAILTCVAPEWRKGARIVGEAMGELLEGLFMQCPGDMLLWSRVLALGEMGRIEIRGPGPDMRGHEVRRVPQGLG